MLGKDEINKKDKPPDIGPPKSSCPPQKKGTNPPFFDQRKVPSEKLEHKIRRGGEELYTCFPLNKTRWCMVPNIFHVYPDPWGFIVQI